MPRLTNSERHQAIGMLLTAGWSQRNVADYFRSNRNTVSALARRHKNSNDVVDRPRSGRPRLDASSRSVDQIAVSAWQAENGN